MFLTLYKGFIFEITTVTVTKVLDKDIDKFVECLMADCLTASSDNHYIYM